MAAKDRNMDKQERHGGCWCGAVRYTVKGEPLRVGLCHCQDCRQTSGSAFSFFGIWPREAFSHNGALTEFRGRCFCPVCGSRVVQFSQGEAEVLGGSLDDGPSDLTPSYELWIGRRESWLLPCAGASQHRENRPG
jgi:hypothetical protein